MHLGSQMDFQSRWESSGNPETVHAGGTELVSGTEAARLTVPIRKKRRAFPLAWYGYYAKPNRATGGHHSCRMAGLSPDAVHRHSADGSCKQDERARGLFEEFFKMRNSFA